jgi:hypothetical protein
MNRSIVTTMALAASLLSGAAMYAETPASIPATTVASTKLVHFSLRNDTTAPITLQAGTQELTIQPGKATSVKLPVGTNVIAETATPNRAAGTVLVQVAELLNAATVALK